MKKTRFIHTTKKSKKKLLIAIIASRIEYRKKSRGPISLCKIDGMNLINKQLYLINTLDAEVIVSLGYKCDKIIENLPENIKVIENIRFESTNNVEDIRLCKNNIRGCDLLIIDGNTLPSSNSFSKINFAESSVIVSENIDSIGIIQQNNVVQNFHYESSHQYRWSGIAYLTGKELIQFNHLCSRENNTKMIHELFNKIIDNSGTFKIIVDNNIQKL